MAPLATYAPWFFMGIAAFFRRPARQLPAWLYAPCLIFVVIAELLLNDRTSRWASWTGLALGASTVFISRIWRSSGLLLQGWPVNRVRYAPLSA
jgi:hypothetical protein